MTFWGWTLIGLAVAWEGYSIRWRLTGLEKRMDEAEDQRHEDFGYLTSADRHLSRRVSRVEDAPFGVGLPAEADGHDLA